jgi:type II secretory pathway pseudopilin PulG
MKRLNQTGFTLVELGVTILVLGIVLTSVISLFVNIQQAQTSTRYLETATYAAQSEIESLRTISYNNLTPGQSIDFTDQLPGSLPSGSTGTVVVSEPLAGLRRVDVTVSYNYKGQTRNVSLSSLIGVLGITQ